MKLKIHNLKIHKGIRKKLRNNMTKAEVILWSRIKNKQLGFKFRRQQSIGPYIVDFYCPQARVAVEVDGGVHYYDENLKKDEIREKYLRADGLKVIRYTNLDILKNLYFVLEDIKNKLEKTTPFIPSLERRGQRG